MIILCLFSHLSNYIISPPWQGPEPHAEGCPGDPGSPPPPSPSLRYPTAPPAPRILTADTFNRSRTYLSKSLKSPTLLSLSRERHAQAWMPPLRYALIEQTRLVNNFLPSLELLHMFPRGGLFLLVLFQQIAPLRPLLWPEQIKSGMLMRQAG